MEESYEKNHLNKKDFAINTYIVPYSLDEMKENPISSTNKSFDSVKLTKEEIYLRISL